MARLFPQSEKSRIDLGVTEGVMRQGYKSRAHRPRTAGDLDHK